MLDKKNRRMVFSPSFTRFVHTKLIYLSPSSSFSIGAENCQVSKNLRSCVISTHPKKRSKKSNRETIWKERRRSQKFARAKPHFFATELTLSGKHESELELLQRLLLPFLLRVQTSNAFYPLSHNSFPAFFFFYLSNKMQLRQRRAYPSKQALCSTPNGHSLHGLSRDALSPRAWTARYKYDQYKNNYFSQLALPRYETSFWENS